MKVKTFRNPEVPERRRAKQDSAVEIRPTSDADLDGLRSFFSRLSPESVYKRFQAPLARVPETALSRLAGGDDPGELRLVAVSGGRVVGHAMYSAVAAANVGEAEVGVVVEDAWQSRGVGALLLRRLAKEARRDGVAVFTCSSLWENRQISSLVKTLCPEATFEIREGRRFVRAPISESAARREKGVVREPDGSQNENG